MVLTLDNSSISCEGYTTTKASDISSASNGCGPHRPSPRVKLHSVHRNRIEFWLGVWEAVSFPCLYPSEQVAALESGSSFGSRCKAWNPGRPLDNTASWLLSTFVIPSRDERGPLHSLFANIPEISQTTERRREYAHKILLTLTQSPSGSLEKLLTVPRLLRKCVSAISVIQRQNIAFKDAADYIDLRLTLYRVALGTIWQRSGQQKPRRVSIVYHHLWKDQCKVTLVLANRPGEFFTRLVDLSFNQVLYSAQELVVFEPLFPEDSHGFKIKPKLGEIYWGEE